MIVSIHDVAPSTEAEVRWLLARLDGVGVERRVLKVIPHEDGTADLRHHPALLALLGDEAGRGSEIVLHGWTHRQIGRAWGSPADVGRARLFGGGRAEFLSLGEAEVARRLRDGVARLRDAGLAPRGFCAPGWLARGSLASLARDAGLDYLVWLSGVEDLRGSVGPGPRGRGRRIAVPATGYLGGGGVGEALAQVGGLLTAAAARRRDWPLRIALHPQHAPASPHAGRAIRLAGALRRQRSVVTYRDLLDAAP